MYLYPAQETERPENNEESAPAAKTPLGYVDWDGSTASNERVIIEKIPGVPGGVKTDEKGNVYVAAKGIYVYTPASNGPAKQIGEVPMGETPSNIAFGDPDLETLYITARTGVYRVRLGVRGALSY